MAKTGKLSKRIAGVKIPKKLRKRGGEIAVMLNNPLVADIIAAGLLLAANRIARKPKVKKAGRAANRIARKPKVKKAGRAAKRAAEETAETAEAGVVDLANVLAFAAREGARAIKARAGR